MRITLSQNLSYCFGVKRTLTLVEELLERTSGKSYYMLGEVVHNEYVINQLKSRGLRVVSDLNQVPRGGTVIIQSHGTSRSTFDTLSGRGLDFLDATCPMVEVIHKKIKDLETAGYLPVIIGRRGHDEVRGIAGQVAEARIFGRPQDVDPDELRGVKKAGIVVQSTFIQKEAMAILERIKSLVPEVKFINTICQPTKQRQTEVRNIAGEYDFILIVGSKTSANTRHLFKLASGTKSRVYLVDDPETVRDLPISPADSVFIASGASTPMDLIEQVIENIQALSDPGPSGKP